MLQSGFHTNQSNWSSTGEIWNCSWHLSLPSISFKTLLWHHSLLSFQNNYMVGLVDYSLITVFMAIIFFCFIDLCQFSHSVVSDYLRPHGLQHAKLSCPSPTARACSNSCPSSQWCHSGISPLCCPLLLLPSIFPRIRVFSNELALHIRWSKFQLQHQSFQWIFRIDFL